MGRPLDDERARLGRVFSRYRADPARRRAWSADNPGNAAIRDELARATLAALAEHDSGGLLLDAGCGTGWWLERLLAEGIPASRLSGVELLPERARAASARAPGADVRCADIRTLPVDSGTCTLVTLFTVLSGMGTAAAVRAALGEARRVLAPGGAIVIWGAAGGDPQSQHPADHRARNPLRARHGAERSVDLTRAADRAQSGAGLPSTDGVWAAPQPPTRDRPARSAGERYGACFCTQLTRSRARSSNVSEASTWSRAPRTCLARSAGSSSNRCTSASSSSGSSYVTTASPNVPQARSRDR